MARGIVATNTLDLIEDKCLVGDGCWQWTGAKTRNGYGQATLHGKKQYAHRLVYELFHGVVPSGLELDHLCSNQSCVRPDHLEPVTHRENIQRAYRHKAW